MRKPQFTFLLGFALFASGVDASAVEVVNNGGFEADSGWTAYSTSFGTPICDPASCGVSGAFAGERWVWLGGIDANETAYVSQNVTIPVSTSAVLSFYLAIPTVDSFGTDTFKVLLDGNLLYSTNNNDQVGGSSSYFNHRIDVSGYGDGNSHLLKIEGDISGVGTDITSFYVDNVSLLATPVPEPEDYALMLTGLGLVGWRYKRKAE